MTTTVFFDIESGPLPEDQIRHLMPEFQPPGNYKDPEKIKANIEEQQAKWLADGALSAVTGRVLCIGALEEDNFIEWSCDEEEETVLEQFWMSFGASIRAGSVVVGFCCKTFDLPFLIRRSWAHKVPVPACLWNGRYWSDQIIDVAEKWACGGRDPRDRISLDNLSKFLGVGQKNGDGKDFAALWASDRPKALEYVKNDLLLTKAAYERMFVNP